MKHTDKTTDTENIPPQQVTDLPNDLTAKSLSTLAAALHPNHPAAELEAMNKKLLALMMEEGDQTRLLRRQTQTLDALFHVLLNQGIAPPNQEADTPATTDSLPLVMALKSQRQCFETIKSLQSMDYINVLTEHIKSKPPELFIDKLARRERHYDILAAKKEDAPSPSFLGDQTEGHE